MKLHLNSVTPTNQDIVRSSIFALCVVVAGNLYQLLNYYIFRPENRPTPQSTHDLLVAVAGRVDTYQPTRGVVTFLFWSLIGLANLALCQGLLHTLRRINHLRRLSMQQRRHKQPLPISQLAFWKQWLLTSLGSFMAFATAAFLFLFFALCIVPVGVVYTRIFMFSPTPFNVVYALMGICLTFIGLVLTSIGVRLIIARRRLIRLA
jgi:hypothetical protein